MPFTRVAYGLDLLPLDIIRSWALLSQIDHNLLVLVLWACAVCRSICGMLEQRLPQQPSAANNLVRRWAANVGLAAVVGLGYFLAAQLSLGLLMEPDGVAVFWPAAGISTGVLIALGPRARWPVAAGAMIGTIPANLMGDRNILAASAFALCNAAEALITAGLIQHYFGAGFSLRRLRNVIGLLAAAVTGAVISGIGGAVGYKLFHSPTALMIITWWHWFASDTIGIIAVAPVVIGLAATVRKPPSRGEITEGTSALVVLTAMTGIIISLPEQPWQTVVPAALLFPMLLWLAARCRPVFAAGGAFMVSLTVVWTTIFGIGHFGDIGLPLNNRILQAQAVILVMTLIALALAALFAERRHHEAALSASEARFARANRVLERERDNKLVNLEAALAAIAHEMRQPLMAIVTNGSAGRHFLESVPPDIAQAKEIMEEVVKDSFRADGVLNNLRALFRSGDQARRPIDLNGLVSKVLKLLHGELKAHGITVRMQLASELPIIFGHDGQLQEVILNLVQNSIDAMETVTARNRSLRVKTERHGQEAVAVSVEDSGPGIDSQKIAGMFDAFVTTKAKGMGLGLAISKMIIERHGGHLTASSDGKNGALFQIVLPIKPAEKAWLAPGSTDTELGALIGPEVDHAETEVYPVEPVKLSKDRGRSACFQAA